MQTNNFKLAQAIATVTQNQEPIEGIIAHSLGAASTTFALSEGMKTAKVVYTGASCWLSNVAITCAKRARLTTEVKEAFWNLFEKQFGKDVWQRLAVDRTAKGLAIPVLLFHDRRDREVSFEESVGIA